MLLATIFMLNATEFLQAGMMAFASGPIMGEISASPEEFSLAAAVYACLAVAAISRLRWFVERMGWRSYVQMSVAVFVIGAAIAASSHHFWQFLIGRSVMALGGASFMTSARMMINLIPAGPRRFVGIAAFATSLAIGNAAAPWVASIAVARDSWHLMFEVLIVLALLAGALATVFLPSERSPAQSRTQSSPLAMASMVCGSFLVLYALQRSYYEFYSGAAMLLALLAAGLLAIGAFVRSQLRQQRPLLLLGELAAPRFLLGLAIFTLCYVIFGATNYLLPMLIQRSLGFPWEAVGKVQALGLLSALPAFVVMAKILSKYPGPKKFYVAGFGALFLFGWRLSSLNGNADLWSDVLPAIAFYGVFIILVMAQTALHAFRDLQHDETVFSHGQQLKNMLSQFGIGLGVALATAGFQWRVTAHYAVLNERFVAGNEEFVSRLQNLSALFGSSTGSVQAAQLALAQLAQQLGQQATLISSVEFSWLLMWIAAACAAAMCVQRIIK
jgi:MFS family permease